MDESSSINFLMSMTSNSSLCLILLIAAYKAYLSYSQAITPLAGSDVSLRWFKNKDEIRLPGELRVVNEGENDVTVRMNEIITHRLR